VQVNLSIVAAALQVAAEPDERTQDTVDDVAGVPPVRVAVEAVKM